MGVTHLSGLLSNGELQALAGHLSVSDTLCTSYVLSTRRASGSEGQGPQFISVLAQPVRLNKSRPDSPLSRERKN